MTHASVRHGSAQRRSSVSLPSNVRGMALSQLAKQWLSAMAAIVSAAAAELMEETRGPAHAALHAFAVLALLTGIAMIFAWARVEERRHPARAPRRWFTPWRSSRPDA